MMDGERIRTWAEINLDNLVYNYQQIQKLTKAKIMAIIKADAYGHGFLDVAKTLVKNDVDYFAVAFLDEAIQLRNHGIKQPILILGYSELSTVKGLVENDITATVYDMELARALSKTAQALHKTAKIHIKVDTGMSRLGFVYNDIKNENKKTIYDILKISKLPNIEIEGIFSHFSESDTKSQQFTRQQFACFEKLCKSLEQQGLTIPLRHICNSAGIVNYPQMHLDMVRPGIIMYGCYPSHEVNGIDLKPVMSVKSLVAHIKEIKKDTSVSYGRLYTAPETRKIATVPIGYADGFSRLLTGKAKMLAGEKVCDVIGAICMDQCMLDVTGVENIKPGDEIVIIGEKNGNTIKADDIAAELGTINYEILCQINKRVPRVYIHNGEIVKIANYLTETV